jgi:hypothetical protein
MPIQIFISYSRRDVDFATKLFQALEKAGYEIWLDRMDIRTGSRWDDEIVKGLNASQIFLVLLSNSSSASQNVKDEIGYAIDHNMQIVPLLIEPCEIPFRLRRVQYVDFTIKRYEEGIKAVLMILRTAIPDVPSRLKKEERKPMDPAALATTVTSIVAPLLVRMGEATMEEVGAQLPEKIGKLWSAITNRFRSNPAASGVALDLVKNAEDADNQEAFTLQLKKLLKEDANFAHVLTGLVEEAKNSISNVGDGAIATSDSIAVGKIHVGRDMSGNMVIGNNNQIDNRNAVCVNDLRQLV